MLLCHPYSTRYSGIRYCGQRYCGKGIVDNCTNKGIVGTKIFVVKITVKSIVLKLWLMIHRLMTPVKKLESKSFPFAVFHVDSAVHDDTSGYDSRSRSSVTLAKAGPPDSQVNNAPFCHTSCQPGLPVAATPSTLP